MSTIYNSSNTDWTLHEKMFLKDAKYYMPNSHTFNGTNAQKPTKKQYKGHWINDFHNDLMAWYNEWNENLQCELDRVSDFFGKDKDARREWYNENIVNITSIKKQIVLNGKTNDKYGKLKQTEQNKAYRGTSSAAGLPKGTWETFI